MEASEALAQVFEDQLGAVAVLQGSFVYDDGDDQPERVHNEMAFSPVDFLAGIISAKPPFSVVLTDGLSMTAALGVGSRPQAPRTRSRKRSWMRFHNPQARNARK